tara:strand:+ start:5809 stop:6957 length:1149 start_codon:yes stop_codon:yes gene_type:complete
MPTKTKLSTFKKSALVLSGGFTKAASWHLGVSLGLEEIGLKIGKKNITDSDKDTITTFVGSSAGALISSIFSSGISPMEFASSQIQTRNKNIPEIRYKDILKLNLDFHKNNDQMGPFFLPPKLFFFYQLLVRTNGFFSTRGLVRYLRDHILNGHEFETLPNDLFVIATQLDSSRKVIFSKYKYPSPKHDSNTNYYTGFDISDSVGASMSAPPIYCPYKLINPQTKEINYFIDGEIRETLSTHAAVDHNCDLIISSWTHSPYSFKREIGSLVNYGLPSICVQALHLMIQKKIITSRNQNKIAREILDSVKSYCKQENISNLHQKKLTNIIEKKLNYRNGVEYIDIYPKEEDHKIFFANSFSLNSATTELITKTAYKRTLEAIG